ncbi:MAG: hypothetical protein ACOZDY_20690 [Pseudomonadota bacterium]
MAIRGLYLFWGTPPKVPVVRIAALDGRLERVLTAVRLMPRWEIDGAAFLGSKTAVAYVQHGEIVEFAGVPNAAMVPVNAAGKVRKAAWRLRARVRELWWARVRSPSKVDWGPIETSPIDNFIPQPRERRKVGHEAGRNWYDFKPNVVPFGQAQKD